MRESLSKRLNLRVNGCPIILNDKLNESELRQHKIKKVGFFERLMMGRYSSNDVIYWSKNCELEFFNNETNYFTITPVLDPNMGAELLCGTSAYLFFEKNILYKFGFQIINSKRSAKAYLIIFEEGLIKLIGHSVSSDEMFKIWESDTERLVLQYPDNNIPNGYVSFMLKE